MTILKAGVGTRARAKLLEVSKFKFVCWCCAFLVLRHCLCLSRLRILAGLGLGRVVAGSSGSTRVIWRRGAGRFPLLLHLLAQLEIFFGSPGVEESVFLNVAFVGLSAVLFRVELILVFVIFLRWCVVPLSEFFMFFTLNPTRNLKGS